MGEYRPDKMPDFIVDSLRRQGINVTIYAATALAADLVNWNHIRGDAKPLTVAEYESFLEELFKEYERFRSTGPIRQTDKFMDRMVCYLKDFRNVPLKSERIQELEGQVEALRIERDEALTSNHDLIADLRADIDDLLTLNDSMLGRAKSLETVVTAAVQKFKEYRDIHVAKGTVEGLEKALTNTRMVEILQKALDPQELSKE